MSDEQTSVPEDVTEAPRDVLAQHAGDPCMPQPVQDGAATLGRAFTVVTAVALGGAIFGLLGLVCTPCMGATRSARLRWQERDKEIESAWQQERALPQTSSPTTVPRADAAHE